MEYLKKIVYRFKYFVHTSLLNRYRNVYLSNKVNFIGRKNITIGAGTVISDGSWFNVNNRSVARDRILIGDNVYIGKRNFFSSGKRISLGDYVMTGLNCNFLGADHKIDNPMKPYISTGVTDDNVIEIGINVWLGANVTVLGNVTIGNGCIIGANSLVVDSIPEFSIAVGSPAKVIKTFDFDKREWVSIGLEKGSAPTSKEYLKVLRESKCHVSKFAAGSSYSDLY